ncbi:hypothetical protein MJO28_010804 [Puccinia striiformis f. sp. tritici]|uniref:Uncharacterized protein n=1 Tax=Puccinia striiformis f. sp. tritici TaxID=168172 RepID=A0ACC0E7M8_9BASI|nr:hypothetical protein MJO28_010804 [Puccinia striiformis f. sp. tritici]KAI7948881.1 hypothetical protein MJO29_010546 [Puccinia striiformis f. sp. tritici]
MPSAYRLAHEQWMGSWPDDDGGWPGVRLPLILIDPQLQKRTVGASLAHLTSLALRVLLVSDSRIGVLLSKKL